MLVLAPKQRDPFYLVFIGFFYFIGASLKRAPQLRVDLAFCHDIYIYIYIYIYI